MTIAHRPFHKESYGTLGEGSNRPSRAYAHIAAKIDLARFKNAWHPSESSTTIGNEATMILQTARTSMIPTVTRAEAARPESCAFLVR
jgi:hypothetical protein